MGVGCLCPCLSGVNFEKDERGVLGEELAVLARKVKALVTALASHSPCRQRYNKGRSYGGYEVEVELRPVPAVRWIRGELWNEGVLLVDEVHGFCAETTRMVGIRGPSTLTGVRAVDEEVFDMKMYCEGTWNILKKKWTMLK